MRPLHCIKVNVDYEFKLRRQALPDFCRMNLCRPVLPRHQRTSLLVLTPASLPSLAGPPPKQHLSLVPQSNSVSTRVALNLRSFISLLILRGAEVHNKIEKRGSLVGEVCRTQSPLNLYPKREAKRRIPSVRGSTRLRRAVDAQ